MISFALAVASSSSDFQPVETRMSGQFIAAQVHTADGKSHWFLVDSGSNESYVRRTVVSDSERKHDVAVVRLDIGPNRVFANAEPVDPAKISTSVPDLPTEGVLGLNLLKQIQLDVDYDAHAVKARFGGALSWAGQGFVPILLQRDADNLYTLTGKVGATAVRLCVDTGATALIFDSARVDLSRFQKLGASRFGTFGGPELSDRFLVDSLTLGERDYSWVIAFSRSWKSSDDGTIGTGELGGSHVILDFPGSCVYVAKPDQLSQAAARLLGIPVVVDANGLRFRDGLPSKFTSSSGAKIVAIRGMRADSFVSALKGSGPDARKTLLEAFASMRTMGLVTTERDGQRQLVPMMVED